jgi:NAD(P)-dependent dehydrogenase (short-subunit alcohol dehydrogenase family)
MGQSNYSAAKEGIIGFTRTVARDMGRYGVTCNAIRPMAATRLTLSDELKAAWEKSGLHNMITSMEAATPEMVAPFVVFLCTDAASNVNGYDFYVGSGLIGVFSQPAITVSISEQGKVWTADELVKILPEKVTGTLTNVAPPQPK